MRYRTDLAKEACEGFEEEGGIQNETFEHYGIEGNRVSILTAAAAEKTGKPIGKYISIESRAILDRNIEQYHSISLVLAEELKKMLSGIDQKDTVLVAGLGNDAMTPDSVGPKTVEKTFVTRHIFEYLPAQIDERMRPVCAFAPGVLGVTGIESADMISSVCKKADVKAILVIDALAARRSERIFSTFQLTDTGIEPGAGVGNKRSALNQAALGVPVIAIGIPTVVYAATLVYDAVEDLLISATGQDNETVREAAEKAAVQKMQDMVVTPKEIDIIAQDSAKILADGINLALHRDITLDEIAEYMF